MRNLMRAIASALKAAFAAGRWVVKHTARGLEKIWEHLPSWPNLGGGGSGAPQERTEAEAGHEAAQSEQQRAEADERREKLDRIATAIFKLARSIRDGQEPDVELAAAVAPWHLNYLRALAPTELARLADPSVSGRRACKQIAAGAAPDGLPDPEKALARLASRPVTFEEKSFSVRVAAYRNGTLRPGAPEADYAIQARGLRAGAA